MGPQLHSQDPDFKSSRWRCCCSHQNQACESPLVGNAHGPAEQAGPSQSSGLTHLPPGPPCSTDLSLSGSKAISPALSHSPPSSEHSSHVPASAGQMPPSRAELLIMVFASSPELVRQMCFPSCSSNPDQIRSKQYLLQSLSCTLSCS